MQFHEFIERKTETQEHEEHHTVHILIHSALRSQKTNHTTLPSPLPPPSTVGHLDQSYPLPKYASNKLHNPALPTSPHPQLMVIWNKVTLSQKYASNKSHNPPLPTSDGHLEQNKQTNKVTLSQNRQHLHDSVHASTMTCTLPWVCYARFRSFYPDTTQRLSGLSSCAC
jgi:hypothetical protein